jgi:hypothetical protein
MCSTPMNYLNKLLAANSFTDQFPVIVTVVSVSVVAVDSQFGRVTVLIFK